MKIGIIGGSGFAGGTLLQILLMHPEVEVTKVTSRSLVGKFIHTVHPNLRNISNNLKFSILNAEKLKDECDLVFTAIPHGTAHELIPDLLETGLKVIDLSADYRIKSQSIYEGYYGPHSSPEYIEKAVYGMPELHREDIKNAELIAGPGCHASSAIYALAPLVNEGLINSGSIIIDSKTGSSGAGHKVSEASHHPFRENSIRPYKMTGHRHTAEIEQELNFVQNKLQYNETIAVKVGFSAHGVNLIRGILSTCHVFIKDGINLEEKQLYKAYRKFYRKEPFIRFIKQRTGLYQLPDPKLIAGTNYADVGFELDDHLNRIVALCSLDNLVKGAAGNAVQCMNIMMGVDEKAGLDFPGLFP